MHRGMFFYQQMPMLCFWLMQHSADTCFMCQGKVSGATKLTYELYGKCLATAAKTNVPWRVTLGTHVSLSCCSSSQLLCLKLFSKNLGHMFTGVYAPHSTSRSLTPVKLPLSFLVSEDVPLAFDVSVESKLL